MHLRKCYNIITKDVIEKELVVLKHEVKGLKEAKKDLWKWLIEAN